MAEDRENLLEKLERKEPAWAYDNYDRSQRAKNYALVVYLMICLKTGLM